MRRLMNLSVWIVLVGGSVATMQWAGQEPEDPSVLSVNGRPLPAAQGTSAKHDPRTCHSCNVGTRPQWEIR